MLVDTESFSYIFDSPFGDDNDLVNKVKTAMLLIQKDYENRGLRPFAMRPVPIFAYGYLAMEPAVQEAINKQYYGAVVLKDANTNVCEVNLKRIWENSYKQFMSYPKFKYLLYTGSDDLDFNKRYKFSTAMSVEISFGAHATEEFDKIFAAVKEFINESVRNNVFV
jgi:ATP-dependent DNA helicase RecQ